MLKTNIQIVLILLSALILMSSNKGKKTSKSTSIREINNCDCDSLWAKKVTKDFVSALQQTTKSDYSIWKDYKIKDGYYVLNAGKSKDSIHCLGLFNNGEAISYKCSKDVPKMLTPLYSYYLNYINRNEEQSPLFETYKEAPEFSTWMRKNSVQSAVYMPTSFPKFPFKIPAKTKAQLAVHEAFHIEVTLRYWFTKKGFWPKWEIQPDRAAVQSCYLENESIIKLIDDEQEFLALTIEALLDKNHKKVLENANQFISRREQRYKNLAHKKIKLGDDTLGDCRIGEAYMEIEEGIADYGSWVAMYNIGTASRQDLLKRYRAKQKDRFYLTGCMLLHASALMANGNDKPIISKMVNAPSVETGNLFTIFKDQLKEYHTSIMDSEKNNSKIRN
ncbi:hypothetical protein [Aquimarina litoralis]|uniref:hypothetical protein n=1 Tax=Aquimarina litoralis TaxID=584605 RepID=UPI001C5729C0|nr:hypothetical protein [Aquimarina litoralis]MBW1297400.1 hypothetical protein [Aquimarina litoralis]